MKTGKKFLLGCGSLLIFAIVGFGLLVALIFAKKNKYDGLTEPYFAAVIPILAQWDSEEFDSYWASEVSSRVEEHKTKRLFSLYSKLGKLISYEEPEFLQVGVNTEIPYPAYVQYQVVGHFSSGDALLSFTLVRDSEDQFHVWSLSINSDVFLPEIAEPKPEA